MSTTDLFQAKLEGLPIAGYTCDKDGFITYLNDAARSLWGQDPPLGIARWSGAYKIFDLRGMEVPLFHIPIARLLSTRAAVLPEHLIIERPDGSRRQIIAQPRLLFADDGSVAGALSLLMDVTGVLQADPAQADSKLRLERQIADSGEQVLVKSEQLRNSEERYHRMIDEIEDYAIILLDRDGMIQNWNKGAEKIKGYTEREIIGQHFGIFYLPEDREKGLPEQLIQRARTTGKAVHEGWRMRKDRSVFWGSIVITALHDHSGEVIGFSKVTRDLTERKNAELRMEQYAAELEFQNSELRQFTYVASHDLQEPLRKIKTFGELLIRRLEGRLDEESSDLIRRMQSASVRMKNLIDDLLSYSRINAEEQTPFSLVNMASVLQEAADELDNALKEKHGLIHAGRLYPVMGSEWQIRQMFYNLLNNAIKYSRSGVPPEIRISAKIVDGAAAGFQLPASLAGSRFQLIEVQDNGIGFEPQYANKIFQVFQRLHGRNDYEGSGVGLSIVLRVVKHHKGFIKATGVPGAGATFSILLPYGHSGHMA